MKKTKASARTSREGASETRVSALMAKTGMLPKAPVSRAHFVLTGDDKAILAAIRAKAGKASLSKILRMGLRLVAAEVGAGESTKS